MKFIYKLYNFEFRVVKVGNTYASGTFDGNNTYVHLPTTPLDLTERIRATQLSSDDTWHEHPDDALFLARHYAMVRNTQPLVIALSLENLMKKGKIGNGNGLTVRSTDDGTYVNGHIDLADIEILNYGGFRGYDTLNKLAEAINHNVQVALWIPKVLRIEKFSGPEKPNSKHHGIDVFYCGTSIRDILIELNGSDELETSSYLWTWNKDNAVVNARKAAFISSSYAILLALRIGDIPTDFLQEWSPNSGKGLRILDNGVPIIYGKLPITTLQFRNLGGIDGYNEFLRVVNNLNGYRVNVVQSSPRVIRFVPTSS